MDESEEMSACDGATAAENRWHCFAAGFLQYPLIPLGICFSIHLILM